MASHGVLGQILPVEIQTGALRLSITPAAGVRWNQ